MKESLMQEWIDTIANSELTEGARKAITIQGIPILLIHSNGAYYAIRNQCTHQVLPLTDGEITDSLITCPFHGAIFCLKTGAVKSPPAFDDLDTYPVRVNNHGIIQIQIK